MRLRAGFVSQAVFSVTRSWTKEHVNWLQVLEQLSCFEAQGLTGTDKTLNSVLAVSSDIISRGAPTLCSLRVERELETQFGLTQTPESDQGAAGLRTTFINEPCKNELLLLFRSMIPICRDLTIDEIENALTANSHNQLFDSQAEQDFFRGPLHTLIGNETLQLIQPQRSIKSIHEDVGSDFSAQRVDFALQFIGDSKTGGFVFEVDGAHHNEEAIQKLDNDRDTLLENLTPKWCTYRHNLTRLSAKQDIELSTGLKQALQDSSVFRLICSYQSPVLTPEEEHKWCHLVHLPIAISRIQKVILQAITEDLLDLEKRQWHIKLIDRDGFGNALAIALDDLSELVDAISTIHGTGVHLPVIQVTVCTPQDLESFETSMSDEPDLLIDISVALKVGQRMPVIKVSSVSVKIITIRSLWGEQAEEQSHSLSSRIKQPEIEAKNVEERLNGYQYILHNVFRKASFRSKQVEVIERIVQGKSVIALLPTGAGKSLTYQLPALVLCGAVIVIDPIRSLMKDQVDGLSGIGIHCIGWMNSWLTTSERRKTAARMVEGRLKVLFISPERMQISEFRSDLTRFALEYDRRIAFAVIDEAHCVSEWGHDFRTAYLRVGENLRRFLKGYQDPIPLVALTGTASYEVLDDVKIELDMANSLDADIRPESMQRNNLKYRVLRSRSKEYALFDTLNQIVSQGDIAEFIGGNHGSGLVFTPHVNGKLGTDRMLNVIRRNIHDSLAEKVDQFHGSGNEAKMMTVMDGFKNGDIRVLCCTKAFGMGIELFHTKQVIQVKVLSNRLVLFSHHKEQQCQRNDNGDT